MFCNTCGNAIKQGEKFCTNCGAPVNVNGQPINNMQQNNNPFTPSLGKKTAKFALKGLNIYFTILIIIIILAILISFLK